MPKEVRPLFKRHHHRTSEPYPTHAHAQPPPTMHATMANPTGPRPVAIPESSNNTTLSHPSNASMSPSASVAAPSLPGANAERPSTAWTAEDDTRLMQLRAKGMNWAPIAAHFAGKTPNACRKRHERLMERRNAESWDGPRVEDLARAYLESREDMWRLVAARVNEKWQTVEAKCMEKGLKTLQTMGRPRRAGPRAESPLSHQSADPSPDDQFPTFMDPSGMGLGGGPGSGIHAPFAQQFAPGPPSYGVPSQSARSRGGSVAPPSSMLPTSAPMATGHRYSLSNSSASYGHPQQQQPHPPPPTQPPVSAGSYATMTFSPTTGYPPHPGMPGPPLGGGYSRPYETGGVAPAGPSLPSLHSFLQSPREPISASY